MTLYERTLAHLVVMASDPGWKQHAWRRAKELDANPSGLWVGIAQDLSCAMQQKESAPEPSTTGA